MDSSALPIIPTHAQVIVFLAGLGAGAGVGIFSTSRTELRKRGIVPQKVGPFDRIPLKMALEFLIAETVFLLLLGTIFLTATFGILALGGLHGVGGANRFPYLIGLMLGAGTAYFLRYLYWRSR